MRFGVVATVVTATAMTVAVDAVAAPPWYVPPDNGTDWLEWAQLIGVVATVIVLGFTVYELRATASERKRLRLRIQQERLEDLAIAIAQVRDTALIQDSLGMFLHLTDVGARAIPLPRDEYADVWTLAEEPIGDPRQFAWTKDIQDKWTGLANGALESVREGLKALAPADQLTRRQRLARWLGV